jgi:hypothetical protein
MLLDDADGVEVEPEPESGKTAGKSTPQVK